MGFSMGGAEAIKAQALIGSAVKCVLIVRQLWPVFSIPSRMIYPLSSILTLAMCSYEGPSLSFAD